MRAACSSRRLSSSSTITRAGMPTAPSNEAFDASLRALKVTLLQQTGDTARLRLQYPLAGRDIDAVVPAVRIDGHWYLADFVQRADASLAAKPAVAGGS